MKMTMKLKNKLILTFCIMSILPMVLCGLVICGMYKIHAQNMYQTYEIDSQTFLIDFYSPMELMGKITENIYDDIREIAEENPEKEIVNFKFVMVDYMEWFNVFGLIFIAVIMIPNVVFAIKCKDGFDNKWNNKYVEVTEQVGRLGCFGFMIINIPGTWFGWWSDEAFALYLIVDTILVMLYCAIWIICFKKNSVFRALALSIIPSMLFLFSGIMSRSVLLIIASVLFAPSHIVISYKNVK